ncbi:MAG TPA: ABC transporter substrate-binding protein [Oligoflexia bacterium]|nr:ABC transporter substrate-binding protein [Oligoflexia bacterium]HMP47334.1 ABC transporter substrate-binding protein [Oligoflexia bacterium]
MNLFRQVTFNLIIMLIPELVFASDGEFSDREATPKRIVSLAPVLTEMLLELEEGSRLVGRTSYCRLPQEIEDSALDVGGYLDASTEKIRFLKPDMVISLKGEVNTSKNIRDLGIRSEEFSNESIKDIQNSYLELARIFGKEEQAARFLEQKKNRLVNLRTRLIPYIEKVPKVLFVLGDGSGSIRQSTVYVAGKNSFYAELLKMLGFSYPLGSSVLYPQIGLEGIRALKPDLIIIGGEAVLADKSFSGEISQQLSKIAKGQLIRIYSDNILYPGINYDLIAEQIADKIVSDFKS